MRVITDDSGKIVTGYEEDGSTECIIPDGVKRIGNQAFAYCEGLTSVIIPNSVTKIGYCAFYCCINLTNVTIESSVTRMEGHAFSCCKCLKDITLSDNLESIGNNPFCECDNIQKVNVNSYKSYKLIRGRTKENFRLCATISIVKKYYNKTVPYTEEEIQDLKEYIKENRIKLFPYALKNIELYCVMFKEMNKIYSATDIKNLLKKVETVEYSDIKAEASAFILEYMYKNDLIGKIYQTNNNLDDLDSDLEEENPKGYHK